MVDQSSPQQLADPPTPVHEMPADPSTPLLEILEDPATPVLGLTTTPFLVLHIMLIFSSYTNPQFHIRRTVVSIPNGPSALAVKEAAWGLARYAAIAQVRKPLKFD